MSKKQKKEMTIIIALAAVLVIMIAAYFMAVKHNENKEKAADSTVNLLHLDTSLATKLEITNTNGSFVFEKKDGTWIMPSDESFEVSEGSINKVLDVFADLVADKCVLNNKDTLSEYDLDKPVAKTTITLSDGTTKTISLGGTVPTTGGYYGMLDDKEGVYTFNEGSVMNLCLALDAFSVSGEATEEP